jgi:hypothetical protein
MRELRDILVTLFLVVVLVGVFSVLPIVALNLGVGYLLALSIFWLVFSFSNWDKIFPRFIQGVFFVFSFLYSLILLTTCLVNYIGIDFLGENFVSRTILVVSSFIAICLGLSFIIYLYIRKALIAHKAMRQKQLEEVMRLDAEEALNGPSPAKPLPWSDPPQGNVRSDNHTLH